jgi:hypothetical protein
MNDADVSKQIQQMVRFIRQEAEEKANEILVSAEEVILPSLLVFAELLDGFFSFDLIEKMFSSRNSILRSYNWLRLRRRRSGKSMSVKRSKFKFVRRCNSLPFFIG